MVLVCMYQRYTPQNERTSQSYTTVSMYIYVSLRRVEALNPVAQAPNGCSEEKEGGGDNEEHRKL